MPDEAERKAFTTCLAGVADDPTSPLRVIVSLRSDFLDRVAEDRYFMSELSTSMLFLSPPNRDGLREALSMPAEMAGFRFENARIIDDMIDAIEATPGSLPLLQFAATQLWAARDRKERLLTEASYQDIGGIAGALASHADNVAASVSSLSPDAPALVKTIFQRLVTPERTRAIASMTELCELAPATEQPGGRGAIHSILDRLIAARLLVVSNQDDSDEATVEIVHESLIHSWPRLGRWLDDNAEDAAFLEQLRTVARQWKSRDRDPGLLWRGEPMLEARRFRQRYRGPLSAVQEEYLQATLALAAGAARKKRLFIAGTMAFLAVLVVAAAVALVLIRNAERQATRDANKARRAKDKIQEQLSLIEAQKAANTEAEKRVQDASAKVEQSEAGLTAANARLLETLKEAREAQAQAVAEADKAREAQEKAEKAQRRVSDERERAEAEAEKARQAVAREQKTNTQLKRMVEIERARADKAESKLGKVSKKLK